MARKRQPVSRAIIPLESYSVEQFIQADDADIRLYSDDDNNRAVFIIMSVDAASIKVAVMFDSSDEMALFVDGVNKAKLFLDGIFDPNLE